MMGRKYGQRVTPESAHYLDMFMSFIFYVCFNFYLFVYYYFQDRHAKIVSFCIFFFLSSSSSVIFITVYISVGLCKRPGL